MLPTRTEKEELLKELLTEELFLYLDTMTHFYIDTKEQRNDYLIKLTLTNDVNKSKYNFTVDKVTQEVTITSTPLIPNKRITLISPPLKFEDLINQITLMFEVKPIKVEQDLTHLKSDISKFIGRRLEFNQKFRQKKTR